MINVIAVFIQFLFRFLSEKRTIEVFVAIAEKIAASTENQMDDLIVQEIKKKLLYSDQSNEAKKTE